MVFKKSNLLVELFLQMMISQLEITTTARSTSLMLEIKKVKLLPMSETNVVIALLRSVFLLFFFYGIFYTPVAAAGLKGKNDNKK